MLPMHPYLYEQLAEAHRQDILSCPAFLGQWIYFDH